MGWKTVECEVCASTVIIHDDERAECPNCGE